MHTQQTTPPNPERLHGLDALRGLALLMRDMGIGAIFKGKRRARKGFASSSPIGAPTRPESAT